MYCVMLLCVETFDAVRFRFASLLRLLAMFLYMSSDWNDAYAIVIRLDRRFYTNLLVACLYS